MGEAKKEAAVSSAERRAAIDVGTNSVKLLVGDVADSRVTPVWEESKQTRLGRGFYQNHLLQPEPIAQTAEAVTKFAEKARQLGAVTVRVIGTSAARDAHNAQELINAIRQCSGLELAVLSGEQEADWAFCGVTTDPELAALPLLILDVGGGSSEFIVGENRVQKFTQSYRFGTVRLFESLRLKDPPGLEALAQCRAQAADFLREKIAPDLAPALRSCSRHPHLIGTGGTATILARMEGGMQDFNRERIESVRLTIQEISAWAERLWQSTLAARQQIPGLPPNRADVILTGIVIFEAIMDQFAFSELRISTRGLRYSALTG